jgi:hypothetical protein
MKVLLRREPTEEETAILCDRLPEFCRLQGPQQAELTDELGFLFFESELAIHLSQCVGEPAKNGPNPLLLRRCVRLSYLNGRPRLVTIPDAEICLAASTSG